MAVNILHLRNAGYSEELSMQAIGVSPDAEDNEIKLQVETYMDLEPGTLREHTLVRGEQAYILRPEAIYG